MLHLGDITKISGYTAPIVDCIIGGSPCQDLSVAGRREGLKGERSGLYMEQIRIVKEMRERDERNGRSGVDIRPRYMVWENVPGAFSSNKGEDFRIVLEETAKIADENAVIPRPADGKWKTSGCIVGDGWSIAWRILDAQFWGVPQRRRRIALVADFGGQSAPEILFVRKSVSGHSEQSESKGKETPSDVARSVRAGHQTRDNCLTPWDVQSRQIFTPNGTWYTLYAGEGGGRGYVMIPKAVEIDMYNQDLTGDKSASIGVNCGLSTGRNGVIEVYDARGNGDGKTVCTITGGHCNRVTDYTPVVTLKGETISGTLMSRDYKGVGRQDTLDRIVCYSCDEKMGNTYCWEEQANTLAARDYKQPQAVCYKPKAVDCRNCTENDINNALQANSAHSLNGNNVVRVRYIVRRLTPLECERLQGYPDGWTDIGDWVDSNGKKCKTSDAARYKALGNSIALPPWKWVLKRICACYERDATMASLFDGIGGFPLIWEQINGKGTCLWASEIEEFPIAVTKARIGGG